MINQPVLKNAVIDYLRAHSELHTLSARQLAHEVSEPRAGYQTWYAARKALELPPVRRSTYTKSPKTARKAANALYPNTHKIVVDTEHLKIVFHGEGGYKVSKKANKKALAASLRLFRLAKFETRSHDLETGIMIMTLKAEALEAAA